NFGIENAAGTYTVSAVNTLTSCGSNMAGSATIVVNPLPDVYSVTGGGNICAGDAGNHISINGSGTGISYQLYNGTAKSGAIVAGTGAILDMGIENIAGTYTVKAA